jgi:hypothetical protein
MLSGLNIRCENMCMLPILLTIASLAQSANTTVPAKYENIIPRIYSPAKALFKNLRYEGNNIEMRGPKDSAGNYVNGDAVADRWRSSATNCKAIFVLRDSLYSQQDHPYRQVPYKLMLPPSWVASAAYYADKNKPIDLPIVFALEDDKNWAAIKETEGLFGSFPRSDSLFKRATGVSGNREQITNARKSIIQLHKYASELAKAAKVSTKQVLKVGAELISNSDCEYFGTSIRRNHIIPIFVENPTAKEEGEGKGTAPEHLNIAPNFVYKCTKAIYKRRLVDGDIAIERYDLSNSVESSRAISLVEDLVPKGEDGSTKVWIWITGPLNDEGKLDGEDALPWVEQFKWALKMSNANMERVALLSKPSVSLPSGVTRRSVFNTKHQKFSEAKMPMSLNLSTKSVQKLIDTTSK